MTENNNPLNKYFRQPSIYVSLPSGVAYPPHVVTPSQTGELGVMPMTAKVSTESIAQELGRYKRSQYTYKKLFYLLKDIAVIAVGENSVHGSDAPETAAVEIAYFFSGLELVG